MLVVICAALTAISGVVLELLSGESMLRGIVHAGIMLLFVAIGADGSHPIGQAFVAIACLVLSATFNQVPGIAESLLCSAVLSLSAWEVVRPGVLLCTAAAATTVPRFVPDSNLIHHPAALATPELLIAMVAASFHRSFICCLGWPKLRSVDALVPAFLYSNALLAVCWASAGRPRAAALATVGLLFECPRLRHVKFPQSGVTHRGCSNPQCTCGRSHAVG